jgi:hypothetical protein
MQMVKLVSGGPVIALIECVSTIDCLFLVNTCLILNRILKIPL